MSWPPWSAMLVTGAIVGLLLMRNPCGKTRKKPAKTRKEIRK
jgi:hypothetical protein